MNVIENIFQVFFVVIMTIGILGLPAYYVLNARRKRIADECEDKIDNEQNAESKE